MIFRFEKRGSNNWWHWNGTTQILNFSNWEIVFDEVSQSVNLQQLNGANVPNVNVPIADVRVKNLSGSDETYTTVALLRERLIALGYNPLVVGGGGSQNLAEVLAIGGRTIKRVTSTAYEFVATDKSEYLVIDEVGDDVVLTLDDSLFDNGDTIIGVGGVLDTFTLTLDNPTGDINPIDTASFTINYLDEFTITKIGANTWILTITNYASNQSGGGATDLGYTPSATNGIVTSSTGTDATLTLADGTNAGLLAPADFTKLGNTSGTNTGDNATNSQYSGLAGSKQDTLTDVNFGAFINARTAKNTLVDADEVVSDDSADSNKAKKTSWLNVWTNYIKPKIDAIFATLASPTFTGTPQAPTPSANDNSTKIATTAYVDAKKVRIFLTADAPNNTVSDTDITTFTFTLPASGRCDFRVCLPFTSASVSTGINTTVKITTGVGANGNVLGNVFTKTRLSATTTSPVINIVDQGANATVGYSALSGVSTAGLTNVVEINCDLTNLATNTSATIVIAFASEVGGSNIDVKRGASMVIDL